MIAGGFDDAVTAFTSVAARKFASPLLPTGEGFVVPLLCIVRLPRDRGDRGYRVNESLPELIPFSFSKYINITSDTPP